MATGATSAAAAAAAGASAGTPVTDTAPAAAGVITGTVATATTTAAAEQLGVESGHSSSGPAVGLQAGGPQRKTKMGAHWAGTHQGLDPTRRARNCVCVSGRSTADQPSGGDKCAAFHQHSAQQGGPGSRRNRGILYLGAGKTVDNRMLWGVGGNAPLVQKGGPRCGPQSQQSYHQCGCE